VTVATLNPVIVVLHSGFCYSLTAYAALIVHGSKSLAGAVDSECGTALPWHLLPLRFSPKNHRTGFTSLFFDRIYKILRIEEIFLSDLYPNNPVNPVLVFSGGGLNPCFFGFAGDFANVLRDSIAG